MKTKQHRVKIFAIAMGTLLAATLATGCSHHHKKITPEHVKKAAGTAIEDALSKVNATPRQMASFESAAYDVIENVFEAKKECKGQHGKLTEELVKETPDEQRILALVDEHIEDIRDIAHNAVETMLEAWNTLSIDQKQKLVTEFEKRHQEIKH